MNKEYNVNNVFNEKGSTINELLTSLFITFLDDDLNFSGIMESDIILNL